MILIPLILLSLLVQDGQAQIPREFVHTLKHAKTFGALLKNLNIIYDRHLTNQHVEKVTFKGVAMSVKAGSMTQRIVSLQNISDDDMDGYTLFHLQNMKDIKQGNDTCNLQSVCVPVPQLSDDPQILVYPKCYEVKQCVGSCCSSAESCHPGTVNLVKKNVVELLYIGNGRFMFNMTREITMEEHTSCSCFDCGSNTPQCDPGFVVGRSCKCECANTEARSNCVGNHVWNAENCKCECKIQCEADQILSVDRCECVRKRQPSFGRKGIGRHHHSHHRSRPIETSEVQKIGKLQVGKVLGK